MNQIHLLNTVQSAFVAAFLILTLAVGTFFTFEPSVGRAITSNFTVTQQITNEISFIATTSATTMVGTIAGLTGGYATGTNVTVVTTNNSTGYNMTLSFSSSTAMNRNNGESFINNYPPATANVPDYSWIDNSTGQAAEFGYTVAASTSSQIDPSFMNNTTICGAGATETADRCWMNPSTTPETIINAATSVVSATTTIKFKVAVPNSPSPSLPSGFYTATGTLTAVTNP